MNIKLTVHSLFKEIKINFHCSCTINTFVSGSNMISPDNKTLKTNIYSTIVWMFLPEISNMRFEWAP